MDFNEIMQQAVKLKGAQMQKYRKKFESWPEFFKNTLFVADDVAKVSSEGGCSRTTRSSP